MKGQFCPRSFCELQRSKWVISHSFDLQTTHRQNLWIRDGEWINLRFNSGMSSLKIVIAGA
ncbi:hypothetical protein LINGRAHAP2_LOCUS4683 [Linum grandiflorum]